MYCILRKVWDTKVTDGSVHKVFTRIAMYLINTDKNETFFKHRSLWKEKNYCTSIMSQCTVTV